MQYTCTIIKISILLCYEKKNYLISLTKLIISLFITYQLLGIYCYIIIYFCECGSSKIILLYYILWTAAVPAVRDFSHLLEQRLIK